jgi:hypothetical protein
MELREFVAETLIAIQEGVRDAILGIDERKVTGKVNPVWNVDPGAKVDWRDYVQSVEFDVAVTATDKAEATGKGGGSKFSRLRNSALRGRKARSVAQSVGSNSQFRSCRPLNQLTVTRHEPNRPPHRLARRCRGITAHEGHREALQVANVFGRVG